MNFIRSFILVAGAAVLAGIALTGCQSTGGTSEALADGTDAVYCAKCETTWVRSPDTTAGGKSTVYRTDKSMVCADCDSAAANYFKTGKLEHTCKACGGKPSHCTVHAGKPVTSSAIDAEQVLTCPKCETTWVKEQQSVGSAGRSNTYIIRNKEKMTCPDCKSAAANFFTTGKLQHACPSCGVDMKVCEKHGS